MERNLIMKKKKSLLSRKDISIATTEGLKKYKGLNFLESYAMFIGVAQLLELGLKNLLGEKFKYDLEKIEKWTLGKTCHELEVNNLRTDFIFLLKSVVKYRNYIAHELLVNKILMQSILKESKPIDHYDKEARQLDKAIIELEQLIFLFSWTNSNNAWD
jgi:hypothetical protein